MITDNVFLRHTDPDRVFAAVRKAGVEEQRIYPGGMVGETIRFLTEAFLKDRTTWKQFTEQFRFNADGDTGGWRCEYWGKMMRGASYVCAVTKDPELYGVLRETVEDLLAAQDDAGRFSSYAPEQEFSGWDLWGRKYVLLGLLRFLDVCREDALRDRIIDAMKRHADYIVARIGPEKDGKLPIGATSEYHRGMNSLSILEPMVLLYELTGEQRYLDFAAYLVEDGSKEIGDVFRDALEDTGYPYQYAHTKAYEMISCFEGLLEYALVTKSEQWKRAVVQFGYKVMEAELSIIGCAGCIHEYFDHANARQTSFYYQGVMQETCVTVTWMKFCARMLVLTGDPAFADSFEQSLENAYYGAVNTQLRQNTDQIGKHHYVAGKGILPRVLPFDSYSPLLRGRRGVKIGGLQELRDGNYYGCCSCIGAAGIGIAPRLTVLPMDTGFAVELYTDTVVQTATASGNPVAFVLSGNYPVNDTVKLVVSCETPESFDLALRIPSWSQHTKILLNQEEEIAVTPGMTVLRRVWGKATELMILFDMRVEALRPAHYGVDRVGKPCDQYAHLTWDTDAETPANHAFVALRRGPMMLARDARLDEDFAPVHLNADTDAYVEATRLSAAALPFPTRCRMRIREADGRQFTVIDYASAGKTWDSDSEMEVWIPKR